MRDQKGKKTARRKAYREPCPEVPAIPKPYGAKDVYGGAPGLETSRNYQHGHPVPRKKRTRLQTRLAILVPTDTTLRTQIKASLPRDGDGDGFIFDGKPNMRPAPIGTPVVGSLTYAGKSPYGKEFQKVADKAGDTYHVGPYDDDEFVAISEQDEYVVDNAKSRVHALELLDKKTRDKTPKKPAAKKAAKKKASGTAKSPGEAAKASQSRSTAKATGKKKVNTKKAAKQVTPTAVLRTKGGDRKIEDKANGQEITAALDTTPVKGGKVVKHKTAPKVRRDNPDDYQMKNGKPVQSDKLRREAHLRSGGAPRALELADERGTEFRLAPARDNEHLWFPKDPNSVVAFSYRQQAPLLDKDGKQVVKEVNGKNVPQFVPGEFGPRKTVYTKAYSDANKNAHFAKVAALIPVMHKLDTALKKDATKNPVAASVLMMRSLGIRPNTMNEEAQAKNLKNKSKLKARSLKAQGKDPNAPIYGATSLKAEHVKFVGDEAHIEFMGKEHVWNTHVTSDPDVVAALRAHAKGKKPTQPLFTGVSDGKTTDYIQQHLGAGVTNKDLRAFAATQIAVGLMKDMPKPKNKQEFELAQAQIAARVSLTLNNDAKQALGSYIAAPIWDAWEKGIKE